MQRIIFHWTAGTHNVGKLDRKHYHYIIDGAGRVHEGDFPPAANANPKKGQYAAHTLNANTGSIGVAVAAMHGAKERPFSAGKYPITPAQVEALAAHCAVLCKRYGLPVTKETVLGHAEVQPTLGIKQRGKWDITWLPGMRQAADPVTVGESIRAKIKAHMTPETPKPTPATSTKPTGLAAIIQLLLGLFKRKQS